MASTYLTLSGSDEVIRQVGQTQFGDGIKVGRVQPADGFADAADGPLGPDEIRQIIEIVGITITNITAVVVLFEKLRALVKPGQPVTVSDAKTGRKLVTIDETTDVATQVQRLARITS